MDPQSSPTPQAPSADSASASATTSAASQPARLAFRVVLPDSALGRVDSAELRLRHPDGTERAWPMAVVDSVLEADLIDPDPGPAEIQVSAFASGILAYSGSAAWDPAQAGSAQVSLTLGKVGRIRVEAHLPGRID